MTDTKMILTKKILGVLGFKDVEVKIKTKTKKKTSKNIYIFL